jgi:branched-chain amino acid aminotransferase
MQLAGEMGLPVVERRVDRTELYLADELFLCGTGVQIAPVTSVDGRAVGTGTIGPVTMRLQERYMAAVRGDVDAFGGWLTPVDG